MRSWDHTNNPPSVPPDLDLEVYTEATRRALYDIVVAVHFTAPGEVARGDWYPDYSPDEAGLVVHFYRGRWLAVWTRLEEAASDLPESRRQAFVRIQEAAQRRAAARAALFCSGALLAPAMVARLLDAVAASQPWAAPTRDRSRYGCGLSPAASSAFW
jgi:hypothetical protein